MHIKPYHTSTCINMIHIISYGYIIRDISLLLHARVLGTVNHNMVLHNIDILHLYCNAAYKASAKFSAFGAIWAVNSTLISSPFLLLAPSRVTVPVTLDFKGTGDLDGRVTGIFFTKWVALIGHGGNANETVFLTIGIVIVQFAPHAWHVNYSKILNR